MKKYSPLVLALYLPLWHTCTKLGGSFPLLINLIKYKGVLSLAREICVFTFPSAITAVFIALFIANIASKISLLLSSATLCLLAYLFFPPSFIYHQLGIFLLISALIFHPKKATEHLFFSLFFITLLHSFSALLTSIHFYGINLPLLSSLLLPITCLYLLATKDIYPSKVTLISLFPLTIFPVAFSLHGDITFNSVYVLAIFLLCASIYVLLEKRSFPYMLSMLLLTLSIIPFLEEKLLFAVVFTPFALLISIFQLLSTSMRRMNKRRLQFEKAS